MPNSKLFDLLQETKKAYQNLGLVNTMIEWQENIFAKAHPNLSSDYLNKFEVKDKINEIRLNYSDLTNINDLDVGIHSIYNAVLPNLIEDVNQNNIQVLEETKKFYISTLPPKDKSSASDLDAMIEDAKSKTMTGSDKAKAKLQFEALTKKKELIAEFDAELQGQRMLVAHLETLGNHIKSQSNQVNLDSTEIEKEIMDEATLIRLRQTTNTNIEALEKIDAMMFAGKPYATQNIKSIKPALKKESEKLGKCKNGLEKMQEVLSEKKAQLEQQQQQAQEKLAKEQEKQKQQLLEKERLEKERLKKEQEEQKKKEEEAAQLQLQQAQPQAQQAQEEPVSPITLDQAYLLIVSENTDVVTGLNKKKEDIIEIAKKVPTPINEVIFNNLLKDCFNLKGTDATNGKAIEKTLKGYIDGFKIISIPYAVKLNVINNKEEKEKAKKFIAQKFAEDATNKQQLDKLKEELIKQKLTVQEADAKIDVVKNDYAERLLQCYAFEAVRNINAPAVPTELNGSAIVGADQETVFKNNLDELILNNLNSLKPNSNLGVTDSKTLAKVLSIQQTVGSENYANFLDKQASKISEGLYAIKIIENKTPKLTYVMLVADENNIKGIINIKKRTGEGSVDWSNLSKAEKTLARNLSLKEGLTTIFDGKEDTLSHLIIAPTPADPKHPKFPIEWEKTFRNINENTPRNPLGRRILKKQLIQGVIGEDKVLLKEAWVNLCKAENFGPERADFIKNLSNDQKKSLKKELVENLNFNEIVGFTEICDLKDAEEVWKQVEASKAKNAEQQYIDRINTLKTKPEELSVAQKGYLRFARDDAELLDKFWQTVISKSQSPEEMNAFKSVYDLLSQKQKDVLEKHYSNNLTVNNSTLLGYLIGARIKPGDKNVDFHSSGTVEREAKNISKALYPKEAKAEEARIKKAGEEALAKIKKQQEKALEEQQKQKMK